MRGLGQVGTQTRADISAPDLALLTQHSPATRQVRVCFQAEIMPQQDESTISATSYIILTWKIGIEVVSGQK